MSTQNSVALPEQPCSLVLSVLQEFKAEDIQVIDVRGRNPLTDAMVVASGRSRRHVKSMAEHLVSRAKQAHTPPLGVEGVKAGEWVLVDLNDVIVHLMLPNVRAFYNLEKLWSVTEEQRASAT